LKVSLDKKRMVFVFSFSIILISNTTLQSFAESEWQAQKVVREDQMFRVPYKITNGEVERIEYEYGSVLVNIISNDNNDGMIEITIPRDLLDSKIIDPLVTEDGAFFVVTNGEESQFKETSSSACFRNLSIQFPHGTKQIEIISIMINPPDRSIIPPIYITTDKNNYEYGETITISGCTSLALDNTELVLDVLNPEGETYKNITIVPTIDGSFSTSLVVEGPLGIDGTYTAKATYAGQSESRNFAVPEFSGFGLIIFAIALSAVLVTRLMPKLNRKMI